VDRIKTIAFRGSLLIAFFLLFTSASESGGRLSSSASISEDSKKATKLCPLFWEIKIHIASSGDYKFKGGKKANEGRYSFELLWTGCMEQDQDDYIIYHENSELLDWKVKEKVKSSEVSLELTEEDFSEKPSMDFNYILRKGEDLHFDFRVESFCVPQDNSEHSFYLNLPASKENTKPPVTFDYNTYLTKGSNSIQLEEKDIYSDSFKKSYSWDWRHQKYLVEDEKPISFFNSHKVKVTLTIIPHY